MSILKEIYALQDPDKLMINHMLQCFTDTASQTEMSRKRSLPDFRIGIIVVSLQAAGTKFSDHIRLYMDSRNSLPVGGR
jgi:hypothetical protein